MNLKLSHENKYSSAIPTSRWEQLRRRIIAGIGSVAFAASLGFGLPSIARAAEATDTGDNVSMEQVAEEQRQAEAQRQAEEAARQAEAQRQAEEAARQAEAQRQAEEAARQAEAQRQAEEAARQAEAQRQAEEAARQAEAQRQAEEAARQAEEQRQAEEAARQAEEQRQAEEAARQAEEQRQAEEAARQAEAQRQAEETVQTETEVQTEENTQAEETVQTETEVQTEENTQAEETVQTETEVQTEENTQAEETVQTETEVQTEEKTANAGKPTVTNNCDEKTEEQTIERTEESTEIVETTETKKVAFTVVEKNGKVYVFTEAGQDEESQRLLSQKLEEWWSANYGANNTPTYVYSISSLGKGTKTVGEDGVVISVDDNGNISIIDTEVTKTEELDVNLENIENNENKEETTKTNTETNEETTKTSTETNEDNKTNSGKSNQVVIGDNDYIKVTEKDGSVTFGFKYILGSSEYEEFIKAMNLPAGTKVNAPVLIPTIGEEETEQNKSLKIGDITISTKDGKNYSIDGDSSKVVVGSDSTKQLDKAADKSENGHLDGDKGKPNHDDPTPDKPKKPTPDKPKKPTPKKPTPKKPTPKNPTPKNSTKPSVPNFLPKTGDDFNKGLANAMTALGVTLFGAGLLSKKVKLSKGGASYGIVEKGSAYERALTMKMMKNNGLAFAGRAI